MVAHSARLYSEIPVAVLKYRIYVNFSCNSESRQVLQNSDMFFKTVIILSMRIIEIVATRCQILRLQCSTPLSELTYSAPLDPVAAFKGPTSTGRQGGGRGRGGEIRRRGRFRRLF